MNQLLGKLKQFYGSQVHNLLIKANGLRLAKDTQTTEAVFRALFQNEKHQKEILSINQKHLQSTDLADLFSCASYNPIYHLYYIMRRHV